MSIINSPLQAEAIMNEYEATEKEYNKITSKYGTNVSGSSAADNSAEDAALMKIQQAFEEIHKTALKGFTDIADHNPGILKTNTKFATFFEKVKSNETKNLFGSGADEPIFPESNRKFGGDAFKEHIRPKV